MGVETVFPVVPGRVGNGEEPVVEANFSGHGMTARNPVDHTLHLPSSGRAAGMGIGVVDTADPGHVSRAVLLNPGTHHDVGVAEPNFPAGSEALEPLHRFLHEIILLDPDLPAERDLPVP